MAKKKKSKLDKIKNKRHKTFALEYIRNGNNATKAYMSVYPTAKYNTAKSNGMKLLTNTYISDAIQDYYDDMWENKEKEIGRTFNNLIKIANSDISDVVKYDEENGMVIRNFDEIDTSSIQSITEIITHSEHGDNINRSVKLYNKQKAESDLLKVLQMITEKVEHTGDITIIPAVRPDKPPEKE